MIQREIYLNKIIAFIDKPFIKVITGIRRSGKSTILRLLQEEISQRGVDDQQIILINFESFNFSEISNSHLLYNYIKDRIKVGKKYYIY